MKVSSSVFSLFTKRRGYPVSHNLENGLNVIPTILSRNFISLILVLLLLTSPTLCLSHSTHSNKVCYLLLHSRLHRESDIIHHHYITTNDGTIRKALNIYTANTSEPLVTVVGNDVDVLVNSMSGLNELGDDMTYVSEFDYCSYLCIMKSKTHTSANLEERRVIEQYDKYHRHSNQLETVEDELPREKRSQACPPSIKCKVRHDCVKYGDLCNTCEVEVWSMNTGTCKGEDEHETYRGATGPLGIFHEFRASRGTFLETVHFMSIAFYKKGVSN
ncbi:predicted protein [Meyerozyma guilliermondii ATCC 6260]|uniref:Uncharacterized protein n=1 Tax=Meyerozyma guilliermondii (strain ATCC 6260 / CBS 566 / DSM 6381 / JCM 1539 / NBRC 10279 / NRRL Y-324) TaxID=294746 RepID=A5DP94_PICGU|nr:uncharacterized protein PGUG_05095 [Meyerozyma guilliermondii ATCC 6260]EDK40997.2 predicted protein [Meyerozyma guilliermondii ATCC 6260]